MDFRYILFFSINNAVRNINQEPTKYALKYFRFTVVF